MCSFTSCTWLCSPVICSSSQNIEWNGFLNIWRHIFWLIFRGWEAEALISFKKALQLEDADAADVHRRMGQRIFGFRTEANKSEAETAQKMVRTQCSRLRQKGPRCKWP